MDMPEPFIRPMYMSCFLVYCFWLLCLPAGYPSSCKQIVTQAIEVDCHRLICSSILYQASNRALCSSAHCPCQMQKGCSFPTCIQHIIVTQWHAKAADFVQMQSFMLCAVICLNQVCQPVAVRLVCSESSSQPASRQPALCQIGAMVLTRSWVALPCHGNKQSHQSVPYRPS